MDPRSYWIGLGWVFTECSLGTDQCGSSDGLSPPQFHAAAALDSTPAVCAGRPPRRQAAPAGLPDVRAPRRPPYPPSVAASLRAGRPTRRPRRPPSTKHNTKDDCWLIIAGKVPLTPGSRLEFLPFIIKSSKRLFSPQSDRHPLILISLGISRFSPFRRCLVALRKFFEKASFYI